MHEMALCTEVVDTVLDVARDADAVSVDGVTMVIGEMRDIIEDMFDSFFHYLTRGTRAENCTVSFLTVPVTVTCKDCDAGYRVDLHSGESLSCPQCGSCEYQFASGNEFLIESIDITTREESEAAA